MGATPFDEVIEEINQRRYHNQRLETHSDIVSRGIYRDLIACCPTLRGDVESGRVREWYNVRAPGDRERKIDLFVGEATSDGQPDITKIRIAVENKSVITAHRNKSARFDDLQKILKAIHEVRAEAIIAATVLVGLSPRVLNVPDGVKKFYKKRGREDEFETRVVPRLSSGDKRLWDEFVEHVSTNKPDDPAKTASLFQTLPRRTAGKTHLVGYDFVLLAPVLVDNVEPASLPRPNALGIDIDADYRSMLETMCRAYTARWHM